MRLLLAILAAGGGAAAAAALAAGSSGAGPCPLGSSASAPGYTCSPLPTATSITSTDPLPRPTGLQTHPSVRPHNGRTHSTFGVYGTVRVALGVSGALQRDYRLVAYGPSRKGCSSGAHGTVASGASGTIFRVPLAAPAGGWCRGSYRGTVVLEGGPYCPQPAAGGPPTPCPEFALQSQLVGRFGFRVR